MNNLTDRAIDIVVQDSSLRKRLLKVIFDHKSFLRENYFMDEFENYVKEHYPKIFKEEEFKKINYISLENAVIEIFGVCKNE